MLKRIGAEESGEFKAIASGTLPSGKPVVVNSDGTVSVVAETTGTESIGTEVVFESGMTRAICSVYDTANDRIVIAYRDDDNSNYGTAVVGTVGSNTISFGTPVVFNTGNTNQLSITFDSSNNKVVIAYRDIGNSGYGTGIVGTVSGTSISFGTEVVFESAAIEQTSSAFDVNAGKVVIAYRDDGNSTSGTAVIGTVSGTSISFGTPVVFNSGASGDYSVVYNSDAQNVIIAYRRDSDTSGQAVVGTVSGTSISFGSKNEFTSNNLNYIEAAYDVGSQTIVIAYQDSIQSSHGYVVAGSISGNTITFGTPVRFNQASTVYPFVAYHSAAKKVVIAYVDETSGSNHGKFTVVTVSGTSITLATASTFASASTNYTNIVYDPDTEQMVVSYRDVADSNKGKSTVFSIDYSTPNITSENYIGIARSGAASGAGAIIDTQGAIAEVDTEVTTTGFVISSGSYDSKSFSVASQETSPKGVFFKTDGTKMYVIGTAGGAVFQYGLSTAFDISTASYDSVTLTDFNVVGTNRNGADLFFHPDGTYVFIVETTNQTNLVRLTLSTPWDLSTAGSKVTNSSLPTNKASSNAQGIFFKPDGSKMYLCENRNAGTDVHGFDLSTNWDISSSSVSSDSSFETTAQDNEIGGLFLNTDGSEFYLIGYQNDKVYRYTISTPYDISTSTFADDFSVGSQETQPQAVTFKPDGTKMYVVGFTNDTVYQYSTSTSVGGPITAGQSYYVQTDGTLGTTAATPSVFAGTAVSATELIVKG